MVDCGNDGRTNEVSLQAQSNGRTEAYTRSCTCMEMKIKKLGRNLRYNIGISLGNKNGGKVYIVCRFVHG
ncbi:AAEL009386-PA [Aedes aegypti]|uniref:AAEL009386-PA n=1 Tax=Aedes aegypti TaxID=7159 RepID=Q16W04_AEDAE|nr:AAEL009386-PA [Aedes aegypti]